MRVYLDICCLKRPFDDQSQPRVRLESEAVLALLSSASTKVEFLGADALSLENDQNPVEHRAAKVRMWLEKLPPMHLSHADLTIRTKELIALGFKNFDALHAASAELSGAGVLCTCDDQFLAVARRHASLLNVRVVDPIDLAKEIL